MAFSFLIKFVLDLYKKAVLRALLEPNSEADIFNIKGDELLKSVSVFLNMARSRDELDEEWQRESDDIFAVGEAVETFLRENIITTEEALEASSSLTIRAFVLQYFKYNLVITAGGAVLSRDVLYHEIEMTLDHWYEVKTCCSQHASHAGCL